MSMKIYETSNFNEVVDLSTNEKSNYYWQDASEQIDTINFLCLDTIVTIRKLEGSEQTIGTKMALGVEVVGPINTYSIDIHIWKIAALIILFPVFCLHVIFSCGLFKKDITPVTIHIWKNRETRKAEMKINPRDNKHLFTAQNWA